MSTMVKSLLGDYSQAVSQFQAASLGGYSGPSTPIGLLGDMVGSVDGIKPDDLVSSTASAMGARRPRRGGNGLRDFLLGTVLSLAGGALMDHLRGVQDDFEKERDEADDLVESAQQCSEAIEGVVDVSDSAVAELISAVIPLLNILTLLLQRHPLGKAIVPMISSIGGDLIDQTNDTITQTCRDRDTAIENCYGEFERRCTEVCERELPETPPEPECGCEEKPKQCAQPEPKSVPCEPTKPAQFAEPAAPAQPSPAPAPSAPVSPQPPVEQGVEKPVASQDEPAPTRPAAAQEKECPPDEEKPQPAKPPQPPSTPTETVAQTKPESTAPEVQHISCSCHAEEVAQSCSCSEQQREMETEMETTKPANAGVEIPTEPAQQEVIDCPEDMEPVAEEVECPEEPVEGEDCEVPEQPPVTEPGECKPEESCCGSLGILGVGVAILGLGLLAEAAVDFIENLPEPEPVPEPVPEPEPEPQPEPEPCPPPAPEPAPDNGVTPPPPELNNVPEPEAPPEKLAHMQAAEAPVQAPDPAPAPAPEPAPGPTSTTEAAPDLAPQESSETSSVHARKAGQW